MNNFFKELFEYSHHFNQRLIGSFIENSEKVPERSRSLISHIINAHQVWNSRIEPGQPLLGVWEMHAFDELKDLDLVNYKNSTHILDTVDLDTVCEYTNTRGQAFKNSVRDILFHVINHSTHHRAQIASEFRREGIEPLVTDYIFYKR